MRMGDDTHKHVSCIVAEEFSFFVVATESDFEQWQNSMATEYQIIIIMYSVLNYPLATEAEWQWQRRNSWEQQNSELDIVTDEFLILFGLHFDHVESSSHFCNESNKENNNSTIRIHTYSWRSNPSKFQLATARREGEQCLMRMMLI